jgi:hypothetical protein
MAVMKSTLGRSKRNAIDLAVIHVEPDWRATSRDCLPETIQAGIQALAGIELSVRNESAGVIQDGMQNRLHLAATGSPDIGAIEHVRLPDLIAVLSFELFAWLGSK